MNLAMFLILVTVMVKTVGMEKTAYIILLAWSIDKVIQTLTTKDE